MNLRNLSNLELISLSSQITDEWRRRENECREAALQSNRQMFVMRGKIAKSRREKLKISQKVIADALCVTQAFISFAESGERYDILERVEKYLEKRERELSGNSG